MKHIGFIAALLVAACGVNVQPDSGDSFDPLDALGVVAKLLPKHSYSKVGERECGWKQDVSNAVADGDGITISCDGDKPTKVRWRSTATVSVFVQPVAANFCELLVRDGGGEKVLYLHLPPDRAQCNEFGKALLSLSKRPPEGFLHESGFDAVATNYRAANPKPVPGEDVRRHSVQAENAVRNKDLIAAARAYGEALKLAPWWPQGRYNRALIMGELGFHPEAIQEMQRYLALVPDAPNARQAQDRIYGWEAQPAR